MQDLSKLRENINEIDNKIIELWKERMELCLSVAEYKRENNLPVLDAQREKELLDRIKNMAGDELGDYSVSLYETIMSLSRSYQQKHLENK
jgi:chorismate mutase/prephenate dehydratase